MTRVTKFHAEPNDAAKVGARLSPYLRLEDEEVQSVIHKVGVGGIGRWGPLSDPRSRKAKSRVIHSGSLGGPTNTARHATHTVIGVAGDSRREM